MDARIDKCRQRVFFFSSRRRHTRCSRDWSSDVCSSDLYSEQGLLALIRAVFFDVCQRLTVVSYCIPGSPQCQVESEIFSIKSRARSFSFGCPPITFFVHQSLSSTTARMKSSVTRTEWLAFWKKIDAYASPSIELS